MRPTIAFRIMTLGATFGVMLLICLPSLHARTRGQLKGTAEYVLHNERQTLSVSASKGYAIYTDVGGKKPFIIVFHEVHVTDSGFAAVTPKQFGVEAKSIGQRHWEVTLHPAHKKPTVDKPVGMWE